MRFVAAQFGKCVVFHRLLRHRDTNFPSNQLIGGCWLDPWYGYVCTPYPESKSIDGIAYQVGLGVQWFVDETYSVRLEYQKRWVDVSASAGASDFDQIRLTLAARFAL